jgi:hypothetical protein
MDGGFAVWEGVARAAHDATGIDAPVSAFDLATAYGLTCIPDERGGAFLDGDDVHYDGRARPVRQHGLVAHEVAHYLLRRHGEDDPEPAARYTAGALMLPRRAYDRDLRETAWDLHELRRRHPNASAELCARRIAELRDAVVTILDAGKVRARVGSPWSSAPRARLTPLERELADAALTSGEVQRANDLLAAWPLFDGRWRRVIVVAEAQQLSLRL